MNRGLFFVLSISLLIAPRCPAAIVFDSEGFEAYTNNQALVGQFGWEDFNAPNGNRFVVQDAVTNGGNRAVSASASSAVAAFVAPRVDYTPATGELVIIEVDIARTIAQFPFNPSSNGFNVDVYNPLGSRILGFGLSVNSNNTGVEAFVTRGDGSANGTQDLLNLSIEEVDSTSKLTEFISFRATLDFEDDSFTLTASGLNGSTTTGVLPFVNSSAILGDADLQHDSVVNAQDVGYFDNYRISTIPEPNLTFVCFFALASLGFSRRRC